MKKAMISNNLHTGEFEDIAMEPEEPVLPPNAYLPCGDVDSDDEAHNQDPAQEELISLDEIIQKNISKNIRCLRTFFTEHEFTTEKGDQATNIINVSEKKTYCVPDAHLEDFFTILDSCRKEARSLHYSERQETSARTKTGIMIDFDRLQKSKTSQFTDKHFDLLTRQISKILRESIEFEDLTNEDGQFTFTIFYIRKPACILQPGKTVGSTIVNGAANKPTAQAVCAATPAVPTTQSGDTATSETPKRSVRGAAQTPPIVIDTSYVGPVYKDGFHILIPEIQVSRGYKRYLNQELSKHLKIIFRDIDHLEAPEKLLDTNCAHVPVYFLGCSTPGKTAYVLSHATECTLYADDDDIDRRPLDAGSLNEGIFKARPDAEPFPINLSYELNLSYQAPTIGGKPVWLRRNEINYRATLESKIQIMVEKSSKDIIPLDDILAVENSVDILALNNAEVAHMKRLLTILDISYATEYLKWFKVICAIAHTSYHYKPLAIWFSHRKPEAWSQTEIDRVWSEATNKTVKRPVTMRALRHWAQESAPQALREIEKEHYVQVLARAAYENEGRVEHAQAARTCHAMIGDKFIVDVGFNEGTARTGYCWFEFVTPGQSMKKGEIYKWRKEQEPDSVHLFISEHLPKVYLQLGMRIREKKDAAVNEAETKYWQNVERNFKMYTTRLGNDGFQNGIIRQAQYRFRQRGFFEELDSYEDILGVGNGILRIGIEPQLIKGFHEYKISKYTETDYVPFDPENLHVKTLLKAFRDVFPEDDVNKFMWYHAATGLDSKESSCILLLLVGGGQNGKSFWSKMVHDTLGHQYCASGKPALLTSRTEKGNEANSAQMQMKGKTWFYFDEFESCAVLNTSRVKSMVSPQYQSGRDLRQTQENFKNTCNPICLSNFDFIINTTDHGTWRRIYYYKNKVTFRRNHNKNNSFEREVDTRFLDDFTKDPLYRQAMLSILVHYYAELCRLYRGDIKNVPVPTIARESELFRNRQDALNRFITYNIVKSPGAEPIGTETVATRYMDWYNRHVMPSHQTIMDVQAQIENSRLATSLERRVSGMYFLLNHRIKTYAEEPLQEGEEDLCLTAAPRDWSGDASTLSSVQALDASDVSGTDSTTKYLADPAAACNPTDTTFIVDLLRNAPTHIQGQIRDNIGATDTLVDQLIENVLSEGASLEDVPSDIPTSRETPDVLLDGV
jgi:phage/plasmid-associated DNA primase